MADKINFGGLIIGAAAAVGALSYLRPDAAISESGGVNYQNIAVVALTGGVVGYFISDKIEDLNPVGRLVDGAKAVAAVPGKVYNRASRGASKTTSLVTKQLKRSSKSAAKTATKVGKAYLGLFRR